MLRCSAKIWLVVVLICIVTQFFTVSMPFISESFAQMDSVFEQRVAEEKAKANVLSQNEDLDTSAVTDMGHMFDEESEGSKTTLVDKNNETNSKLSEVESDVENDGGFGGVFVLIVILLLAFISITFI